MSRGLVEFRGEFSNIKQRGFRVGKWLVVSPSTSQILEAREFGSPHYDVWRIYKIIGGLVFDIDFGNKNVALEFATMLNTVYGEFLDIWEADKTLDPLNLAKWSIPDGLYIWSLIETIIGKKLKIENTDQLKSQKQDVLKRVKWWKNEI